MNRATPRSIAIVLGPGSTKPRTALGGVANEYTIPKTYHTACVADGPATRLQLSRLVMIEW